MVKIYHDLIASPRMLRYAAVVGVLILVFPVFGILLGALEEEYGIAAGWAYISFIPGILIYWWGVLWLLNRKKGGYFPLFFGWLANSWCIFPFMNAHYQSLHLPSFVFLSLLGVVLSMVIASSREVKSWLSGVR
ncbi:hypothetical protein [Marinobacter sp. F3R11]|uniref:hypothetical protein n=1 Tax=Marinobacter sp. F3R11 TaxID=2267231 RepID=UPI000DEA5B53|nr:hypothetical protein [Marinobacter sp. F3R11]RBW52091.1 hypothetical protein DS878_01820 [Marinobacter sp. F3R11]